MVIKTRQGSEVLDRLMTTDRFAPLRPPPSSVESSSKNAPTLSNTVGRSLIGADHLPNSGESAMSDSDTDDDCDTDVTDPEDDGEDERTLTTTVVATGDDSLEGTGVNVRSGTLIVDSEAVELKERKRALRLLSGLSQKNGSSPLDLHIGWMHKLGRINKSWRKRFFVVTHGQLRYYTNSSRSELKGTMPLLSTKVSVINASVFKPPSEHCLEVSSTSRRLVLACTTVEEQEIWRRSLQKATVASSSSELPPGLVSIGSGMALSTSTPTTTTTMTSAVDHLYGMHIGDDNTASILQNSEFAGFIKKRGRINKTWNTRLFVLRGPLLTYYEAEEKPSIRILSRKGAVSITNVTMSRGEGGGGGVSGSGGIGGSGSGSGNGSGGGNDNNNKSRLLELILKEEGRRLMLEFVDITSLNGWYERIERASVTTRASHLSPADRDVLQTHSVSKAAHCAECDAVFSLFVKSYQCPACGLAFCSDHSSKRLPLPEITGTNEVTRCCNGCYKIESSKLIARQADAKRHREESELVVRKREVMNDLNWWYRDAENTDLRHGPFDSEKMLAWYDHGYFQSDLVMWWCFHADGRNGLRRPPVTISILFIKVEEIFSLAFQDALEESYWVESLDPATNKSYYYNIKTEVSAWELPTVTTTSAAAVEASRTDNEESGASTDGNTTGDRENYDVGARLYTYDDAGKWYYKDQNDVVQGPFHADDMRAWMDAGYFNSALYARIGNTGPYRLLQNIYSDLSLAFTYSPFESPPNVEDMARQQQQRLAETKKRLEEQQDPEIMTEQEQNKSDTKGSPKLPAHARIRSLSAAATTTTMSQQQIATSQRVARLRSASRGVRSAFDSRIRAGTLNSIAETGVLRKGFLAKRGRVNRGWKRRYFVLDTETLTYWTKEPKDKGKKKGCLVRYFWSFEE